VQDESHVPGDKPIDLPDDGTRRVWKEIAPEFAQDRGVLYELLNEPRPEPNPGNWKRWKEAMMDTIRTVRETGARNVVVADGLGVGQVMDGAPLLDDPQVAYASHPYALHAQGQTPAVWDAKFGRFSRRAPVIITEWISGGYYCDANTAQSTVEFFQYLQQHQIGLEVGVWDWASGGFGSARWGFPPGQFSRFEGLQCHEKGFGLGASVERWYKTGVPPASPE
jgi:endoglucanase